MGSAGGKVSFKGSSMFVWDSNPEERAKQFRYEWKFNDKVVSEELDFEMSVEELMKRSGITKYNASKSLCIDTFNIINRESRCFYFYDPSSILGFYPFYAPYDWFILVNDGGKTNLASLRVRSTVEDGATVYHYTVMDNAYENHNSGASIPVNPAFHVMVFFSACQLAEAYITGLDKITP